MKTILAAAAAASLCLVAAPALAQAPAAAPTAAAPAPAAPPVRTITQVRGDLYKVNSGAGVAAVTVFLVTRDAIILADPLNPEFADWLKAELATRFPGKPVRFVLETHYHWDHARGGKAFDQAVVIAQEEMPKNLAKSINDAPPPGDSMDRNGDDKLDRVEATGGTRAQFDRLDANKDGFLTQAEMGAEIRRPDIVFKDRYIVDEGGQRVQLIHAKNRHSSDLYDIYFPAQKVLFAGDYVWVGRMCCGQAFDRRSISTWIDSIKALEALDFDILINSHWAQGTKAEMVRFRQYLEDLRDAVAAGIKQGKTADELAASVKLDKYKDFVGYDMQLPVMVRSAYDSLTKYAAK